MSRRRTGIAVLAQASERPCGHSNPGAGVSRLDEQLAPSPAPFVAYQRSAAASSSRAASRCPAAISSWARVTRSG